MTGILDRSDLFPRPGKNQHAFCIDIDREGDVRVLANVEHDRYWADTMMHELGHGAYDLGFDHIAAGPLVRSSYHADQHVPQERPGVGPLAAATA